jgi:hypothetical protein
MASSSTGSHESHLFFARDFSRIAGDRSAWCERLLVDERQWNALQLSDWSAELQWRLQQRSLYGRQRCCWLRDERLEHWRLGHWRLGHRRLGHWRLGHRRLGHWRLGHRR